MKNAETGETSTRCRDDRHHEHQGGREAESGWALYFETRPAQTSRRRDLVSRAGEPSETSRLQEVLSWSLRRARTLNRPAPSSPPVMADWTRAADEHALTAQARIGAAFGSSGQEGLPPNQLTTEDDW